MKQRNPFAVFILPALTLGVYGIVWAVKTKNEMNRLGAQIPTAWLIIIPFVSIYWLWKYSEGVEKVTSEKLSTPLAFVLEFLLGSIGNAILQSEFNKVVTAPADPVVAATPPPAPAFVPGVAPSPFVPDVAPQASFEPQLSVPSESSFAPQPTVPVEPSFGPQPSVAPDDNNLSSPTPMV